MSVGEDQSECPLCMELLELDDINFFPCTCGYQICRFCWHRIRTDENGLCPACRKSYPEDPAEFKPLTEDELQRIKKERRQKEAQRKQKAAENRKHLANVRVVQKNLVFVVGLSQRLADPEVLKKHEYFGKFGKIHKVVINQSTSYAGAQGPSASAYVTYHRPEDALKAIQAVNNIHVDGRTLKASLGTTKYCSHFLRGAQCPKLDCMYLHELGEEAASFTKDEMQQGKHQEYEQKLYELFMNSQNLSTVTQSTSAPTTTTTSSTSTRTQSRKKASSPVLSTSPTDHTPPPHTTKEAWPSLQSSGSNSSSPITTAPSSSKPERLTNGNPVPPHLGSGSHSQVVSKPDTHNAQNRAPGFHRTNLDSTGGGKPLAPSPDLSPRASSSGSNSPSMSGGSSQYINGRAAPGPPPQSSQQPLPKHSAAVSGTQSQSSSYSGMPSTGSLAPPPGLVSAAMAAAGRKLPFQSQADSMSLFSSTNGFPAIRNPRPPQQTLHPLQSTDDTLPAASEIPDTIPVSTSTDWQAAFGFTSNPPTETHDDDLGFDPWNESAKGLAEIIEKESSTTNHLNHHHLHHHHHHNSKTQYSLPVQPPHGHSSPRQQDMVTGSSSTSGMRHPPGMPQLVSSMAQITQLLENRPKHLPPGFTHNHIGAMTNNQTMCAPSSKIMGLMHIPSVPPNVANHSAYGDMLNSGVSMGRREGRSHPHNDNNDEKDDMSGGKDWQDGLRALFPNINISFGASQANEDRRLHNRTTPAPRPSQQHNPHTNWSSENHSGLDDSWDPAIVTSGNIADSHTEEPHWMASLQHLTEDSVSTAGNPSAAGQNHRLPVVPPMPFRSSAVPSWPPQSLGGAPQPPPGFHTPQIRPHAQVTPEVQQLAEGFP